MKRSRLLAIIGILLAGLVLAGLGLAAGAMAWSWWADAPLEAGEVAVVAAEEPIHIATPVQLAVRVRAPWYRWPVSAQVVDTGEGVQVLSTPKPHLSGGGIGWWEWTAAAVVQTYRTGVLSPGTMDVVFTADRNGNGDGLTVRLPDLEVVPRLRPEERPALTIAPPVAALPPEAGHPWYYWVGIGVLILVVVLILLSLFIRRDSRAVAPPVPPWEAAGHELDALASRLPMDGDRFFLALTDIVRWYLEARFQLPATEETTPEFLLTLKESSALNDQQAAMLAAFLWSADLVKFARAEATVETMHAALTDARGLVDETRQVGNDAAARQSGPPPQTVGESR